MRKTYWVLLALVVSLLPTLASAQTQLTISPTQVIVYESQEGFVRLTGSNLLGSVSTLVRFVGPPGTFDQPPSNPTSTAMDVEIPIAVAITTGQYSVSVLATDATGTRTIGPVTFNVVDLNPAGEPPQFTIPEIVVGEATSSEGAIVTFDDGGASCTRASGSFFPMGSTSDTCSASNQFGTTSITFTVVVTDTVAPVITVPDDISQTNPVVTFTVTATDNIDGTITSSTGVPFVSCFPASGATFPQGDTVVQCRAADRHFNFADATFNVHVSDTSPPTLFLPSNITDVEAEGPTGTQVFYSVTASDGTVTCNPPSGSFFGIGTTTVNCSATNDAGTTTGSFTIGVVDTIGPSVNVPDDMIVEATGPSGAAVSFTVTATDIVDGNRPVTCTPASGSTFGFGTTTVQCHASDTRGNQGNNSFDITVRDTTPPDITTPVSPYHVEATSASGAVVNYTVSATDIVDGTRPVVCTPASGFTLALNQSQLVTCTSSDTRGNTATKTFTAEVSDTTPPVITSVVADPHEIIWPPNHKLIPIVISVTATDAVDANPFVHILSVTSDQPEDCHCGDGDVAPDEIFSTDGNMNIQVRAERTSGQDRHYTVTVAVTDSSGNTSIGTVVISVHP